MYVVAKYGSGRRADGALRCSLQQQRRLGGSKGECLPGAVIKGGNELTAFGHFCALALFALASKAAWAERAMKEEESRTSSFLLGASTTMCGKTASVMDGV